MPWNFVAQADNTPPFGATNPLSNKNRFCDAWGNLWGAGQPANNWIQAHSPDGTLLYQQQWSTLIDQIRTFVLANSSGSGWAATGGGHGAMAFFFYYPFAYMIVTGQIYQGGATFQDFVAILTTAEDGTPTVAGVTWTAIGYSTFDDNVDISAISIMGTRTLNDPILTWANEGFGPTWGKVWPSINSIIAGPCSVFVSERTIPSPSAISSDAFWNYALAENGGSQLFAMPGSGGATNVFMYVCKTLQQANHVSGNPCPFYETQFGTYPDGFMAVMDFGVVAEPTALPVGSAFSCSDVTITPTVAANCFKDSGGTPYSFFADAWKYFDGSTGLGANFNDYNLAPYVQSPAVGGKFDIYWLETFQSNNTYTGGNWSVVGRVRVMNYDPVTEVFTDITLYQGPMATIAQVGGAVGSSTIPGSIQIVNWAIYFADNLLYLWNFNGPSGTATGPLQVWLTAFARPTPASAGGRVSLQYRRKRL